MIEQSTFTREHIQTLQSAYKSDPTLIEKSIFAFGVLEAVSLL
jgi:hypothetical protein